MEASVVATKVRVWRAWRAIRRAAAARPPHLGPPERRRPRRGRRTMRDELGRPIEIEPLARRALGDASSAPCSTRARRAGRWSAPTSPHPGADAATRWRLPRRSSSWRGRWRRSPAALAWRAARARGAAGGRPAWRRRRTARGSSSANRRSTWGRPRRCASRATTRTGSVVTLDRGRVECDVAPRRGRPPFVVEAGQRRGARRRDALRRWRGRGTRSPWTCSAAQVEVASDGQRRSCRRGRALAARRRRAVSTSAAARPRRPRLPCSRAGRLARRRRRDETHRRPREVRPARRRASALRGREPARGSAAGRPRIAHLPRARAPGRGVGRERALRRRAARGRPGGRRTTRVACSATTSHGTRPGPNANDARQLLDRLR